MHNLKDPIPLFEKWFNEELNRTKVLIPTAVCLSTTGLDDFPNTRFVSYKELVEGAFIITGPLNSRKGVEIQRNPKVALTFWWPQTQRQIRIQGVASMIPKDWALRYFEARSMHSKAVSVVCNQGKVTHDLKSLEKKVLHTLTDTENLTMPATWGGYAIQPIRMEFMEFKKNRFHDRKLFELKENAWSVIQIQP